MMPDQKFEIVSRKASASPATGYAKTHKVEQEKILNLALEVKA
jgi:2-oxoglutarate dehydrogenase E1 component